MHLPHALFKKRFILLLAVLDLCCHRRAFFSFGEWGLLSSCGAQTSHCRGVSYCGAPDLGMWASVVVAHGSRMLAY